MPYVRLEINFLSYVKVNKKESVDVRGIFQLAQNYQNGKDRLNCSRISLAQTGTIIPQRK